MDKHPQPGPSTPSAFGISSVENAVQESVKLLLLDFRSGEAVNRHPELSGYLKQGATIKSAEPRITETGTLKLLVVLSLPEALPVQA